MPFIRAKCQKCGKIAEVIRIFTVKGRTIETLKCGHILKHDSIKATDSKPEEIESIDGKRLFPFQNDGVNFALKSNVRLLIADEMGLGKTPQALCTLQMNEKKLLPVVIVVKASLTIQWQHEAMRWLGEDFMTQVIEDSLSYPLPGMKAWIISYDMLRRFSKERTVEKFSTIFGIQKQKEFYNSFIDRVIELGCKTVILDECQQIKNTESQRTVQIRNICSRVEHIIALSGTPIKNNALEYFSILNILSPEIFPSKAQFLRVHCQQVGKLTCIYNPQDFQEITKKFIIRRKKCDVLKELPIVQRQFSFHEMEKQVKKAYDAELAQFQDEYENNQNITAFQKQANLLAYIAKMRKIVGIAKIDPTIDRVMEFLGSNEEKKICLFVHHHDVHNILKLKLNAVLKDLDLDDCLNLTSDLSNDERTKTIKDFIENPKKRVFILSTLSSGEGLDGLQKVCDCIILLERQWNPSNEEQVEGRISRIGQESNSLTAIYPVAVGTIDEFFASLVEKKRDVVGKTLDGESVSWNESDLMSELMEILGNSNRKMWKL